MNQSTSKSVLENSKHLQVILIQLLKKFLNKEITFVQLVQQAKNVDSELESNGL